MIFSAVSASAGGSGKNKYRICVLIFYNVNILSTVLKSSFYIYING